MLGNGRHSYRAVCDSLKVLGNIEVATCNTVVSKWLLIIVPSHLNVAVDNLAQLLVECRGICSSIIGEKNAVLYTYPAYI